jgi:hypothetical protein
MVRADSLFSQLRMLRVRGRGRLWRPGDQLGGLFDVFGTYFDRFVTVFDRLRADFDRFFSGVSFGKSLGVKGFGVPGKCGMRNGEQGAGRGRDGEIGTANGRE